MIFICKTRVYLFRDVQCSVQGYPGVSWCVLMCPVACIIATQILKLSMKSMSGVQKALSGCLWFAW